MSCRGLHARLALHIQRLRGTVVSRRQLASITPRSPLAQTKPPATATGPPLQDRLYHWRLVIRGGDALSRLLAAPAYELRVVTRMMTARIVVLTIALSAGGVAAYLVSNPDKQQSTPTEPIAPLPPPEALAAHPHTHPP